MKEKLKQIKKELDEIEKIDPILRRKLEAEGRRRLYAGRFETVDEMLDDPRRGQGVKK